MTSGDPSFLVDFLFSLGFLFFFDWCAFSVLDSPVLAGRLPVTPLSSFWVDFLFFFGFSIFRLVRFRFLIRRSWVTSGAPPFLLFLMDFLFFGGFPVSHFLGFGGFPVSYFFWFWWVSYHVPISHFL